MNTKLITALRTSAKAIENGTFSYRWKSSERCNCGVLACALLGISSSDLSSRIRHMPQNCNGQNTWTEFAATHCPITGVPEDEIFRSLLACGLTQKDFKELEFLRNPEVVARMVLPMIQPKRKWWQFSAPEPIRETLTYDNARHVSLYMRAWADILEESGREDSVQEPEAQEVNS